MRWRPRHDCLDNQFRSEPGVFRHCQLVVMTVSIRSIRKEGDKRFVGFGRKVEVNLRRLILVGRTAEMVNIRSSCECKPKSNRCDFSP